MPAQSERQRRFMWVVHGIQKGKISPSHAGSKASQAAHSMKPSDVKDFLMEEMGLSVCNEETKLRILQALKGLYNSTAKEIVEPMMLEDEDDQSTQNVIASTKAYHGDFDSTLAMYRGFEFTPKENQAIQNFTETKPTAHDKFKVQYSKSDDYGNTSTVVVKKLREKGSGQFVFVALTKVRSGQEEEPTNPETPTPPEEQGQTPEAPPEKGQQGQLPPLKEGDDPNSSEIKITKSLPFKDSDGSEILTNFIQAVYHEQA